MNDEVDQTGRTGGPPLRGHRPLHRSNGDVGDAAGGAGQFLPLPPPVGRGTSGPAGRVGCRETRRGGGFLSPAGPEAVLRGSSLLWIWPSALPAGAAGGAGAEAGMPGADGVGAAAGQSRKPRAFRRSECGPGRCRDIQRGLEHPVFWSCRLAAERSAGLARPLEAGRGADPKPGSGGTAAPDRAGAAGTRRGPQRSAHPAHRCGWL